MPKLMKQILSKWYISMFFIPVLLTYLTNYIKLPDIFSNWEYSIIASLIILIGILVYELKSLKIRFEELNKKPDKRDKKIIRELLNILDLDDFHKEVFEQDAWHGYRKDVIEKIIIFQGEVQLIKNKTSDFELNLLLNNFSFELDKFHEYSGSHLFGGNNYFILNKDTKEAEIKSKEQSEKMNQMTKASFAELEILMEYLRNRKYL
jgi:hypothetical protein